MTRLIRVLVSATVIVALAACTGSSDDGTAAPRARPATPIGNEGRWFTDAAGRVVMFHGVNFVEKWAPYTPEADGFDDDDAALLAASGFNLLRLGVVFEFLMPEPGRIDRDYLASLARTVDTLAEHDLWVLLDFHQDGWGPATHGNGMPEWATLIDGRPNPPAEFPLYYIQNPALQRAFDNFWANRPGPDGVPLQTHYATAMATVARRFADTANVIGYEAMNEPWPGTDWTQCASGCPDLEVQLLVPFHERMTAAVSAVDPDRPVFVEPFVLFNFGNADTALPGDTAGTALATHVYALDDAGNRSAMDRSVAAAARDGAALLVTEWGAVDDPEELVRTADELDARLVPWVYWSHNGHIVEDSTAPLEPPNLDRTVLDALVRPYPTLVNGTPTRIAFDAASATLEFAYTTARPNGHAAPAEADTVVVIPKRRYPDGYKVALDGAEVTSEPCAGRLILRNERDARTVRLRVTPARAGGC